MSDDILAALLVLEGLDDAAVKWWHYCLSRKVTSICERLRASTCDFEKYQKKDRERKRKRSEMCPEELQKMRKRGKVATRRWRVRKSTVSSNISSSDVTSQNADNPLPHKSPASFGKAKCRVENALPKSPRKRVAIVGKLAKDMLKVKWPKAQRKSTF